MLKTLCHPEILDRYKKLSKIEHLLPWQNSCLSQLSAPDYDENLIFSAPTSAGKTLVAEILMQYSLIQRNEKVIFLVPIISTGEEKVDHFKKIFGRLSEKEIRVESYLGNRYQNSGLRKGNVAVCTIERGNQLINRLLKEDRLHEVGLVVVDEIHMVGDKGRGFILELLLTKILYYNKHLVEEISDHTENPTSSINSPPNHQPTKHPIQILGMSATCPNANQLATWLNAKYYETTTRPVKLSEYLYIIKENRIFSSIENLKNNKAVNLTSSLKDLFEDNADKLNLCNLDRKMGNIGHFCFIGNLESGSMTNSNLAKLNLNSAIVFRENRQGCVHLAVHLAKLAAKIPDFLKNLNQTLCDKICNQITYPELKNIAKHGVAFHNASLSMEERNLIENGFRNGAIKILVATSTLASGVNLPAQRVIIRHGNINKTKYHQMIGRAGRYGLDLTGESFLMVNTRNETNLNVHSKREDDFLYFSKVGQIQSQLENENDIDSSENENIKISRILMDNIVNNMKFRDFFEKTFYYSIEKKLPPSILKGFSQLADACFVVPQAIPDKNDENEERLPIDQNYQATQLGKAALSAGLNPDAAKILFEELKYNMKKGIIFFETDLHLIYLMTSVNRYDRSNSLDFNFSNLNESSFSRWRSFVLQLSNDLKNQTVRKIITITLREEINEDWLQVLYRIFNAEGFSENRQILHACASSPSSSNSKNLTRTQSRALFIPDRLKTCQKLQLRMKRLHRAYILLDICSEIPFDSICNKYCLDRGDLLKIHSEGYQFAGLTHAFCNGLNYTSLAKVINNFKLRLDVGISEDLLELIQAIPFLAASKARILYDNNFVSPEVVIDKITFSGQNQNNPIIKKLEKIFIDSQLQNQKFDESKIGEINVGGNFWPISQFVDKIVRCCFDFCQIPFEQAASNKNETKQSNVENRKIKNLSPSNSSFPISDKKNDQSETLETNTYQRNEAISMNLELSPTVVNGVRGQFSYQ